MELEARGVKDIRRIHPTESTMQGPEQLTEFEVTNMEPAESALQSVLPIYYGYAALHSCGTSSSVHMGEVSEFLAYS